MWHDLSAICKKPCLCDLTPRGWKHSHNSLTVPRLDAFLLVRQCHIQNPPPLSSNCFRIGSACPFWQVEFWLDMTIQMLIALADA